MRTFEWELTLKFPDNTQEIRKFEPLIWYEGPKMFVDEKGEYLLSWYEDKEEIEVWFLIKNPENIRKYMANQKTLRDLLLEGKTFLVFYNFEEDAYFIKEQIFSETLKEKFILPAENSFLGNLYGENEKLLELHPICKL